jgi:protein-L-isoaspartate(D-aspartate) O-methyltransferase
VAQQDAAAILADGSLAYLTYRKVKDAPEPADRMTKFFIHAYGPAAEEAAERFAACVRIWDREVRESGYPADDRPPGRNARRPAAAWRCARQAQRTACPPVAGPDLR